MKREAKDAVKDIVSTFTVLLNHFHYTDDVMVGALLEVAATIEPEDVQVFLSVYSELMKKKELNHNIHQIHKAAAKLKAAARVTFFLTFGQHLTSLLDKEEGEQE
jgi:hypothetical protein